MVGVITANQYDLVDGVYQCDLLCLRYETSYDGMFCVTRHHTFSQVHNAAVELSTKN